MSATLHASTRRELLLGTGVLFAWAYLPRIARAEGRDPRFLTIVLRGALDGLAAVAPVGDPDWIKLRGGNALRLDGKTPALPLDGFFALNPAMPNVHRLYQAGEATIVHAVATPYRERSHFDGQDVLESGLSKPGAVDTGWLNRALKGLAPGGPANSHGRRAFAVGPVTPLVVRGPAPVLSWTPPRLQPVSEETAMRLLELYRHTDPIFARALEDRLGLAAMARAGGISDAPDPNMPAVPGRGIAQVRAYFAEAAGAAAKFLASPEGPRIGALALDGWDTHVNEGADARPVGAGEEFRAGAGGLGEIGAHLLDAADLDHRPLILGLALDAAGARQGGEADAVFEHPRQSRIGVAIEVEETQGGFVAHRRSPRRHP